jgi:glycosyltransferase involved in cell wall biosynthesis
MKRYLKRHFARQLRSTQLVLCQTSVVEQRIRDAFGYASEAFVCSSAVSPHLAPRADRPPMPARLECTRGRFRLLYLTKYHAHKNLEAIVEMYSRFRNDLRDTATVVTIAPEHHRLAPGFLKSIDQAGVGDLVVNVGPIPHAEVGDYYQHADALLMPTTLETFGIPYIEAMRFGVPILTSDLDFARAVCGDAAEYFDPWDVATMRDAIVKLRDDVSLRQRLSDAGRLRLATMFRSWDEITSDIVQRLERIAVARTSNSAIGTNQGQQRT